MRDNRQFARNGVDRRNGDEAGFVLLAVLFLVALLLIALAVAAPQVAKSIQRDKEAELIHRGLQYKRAIKLYYAKFGSYPANIDQLMNTNQVRFLRKRYTDPFTGKDDWKIIYFGQAHIRPLGLFGQPIMGGATAGSSGLGGTGTGGMATPIGSSGSTSGSAFGGSTDGSSGSSSFGSGSGSSFGSGSGSSFGSGSGSSFGSGSGSSYGSGSGSSIGSGSGSTASGSMYASASGSGSGSGSSTGTGSTTGSGTGSAFGSTGSSGSTLGGGPIVGVVIPDTRASIKEYKKQKHYNEWEFVYDPLEEQMQAGGLLGAGQQNLNGATPIGNGFGSSTGGSSTFTSGPSGGQIGGGIGGQIGGTSSGTGTTPPQQ
jgi:hypothetical protein